MSAKRLTVLCFVSFYLPGDKSGGPVRSIANLVSRLGDDFNIRVVTRNRDFSDKIPYSTVSSDSWNAIGKALVFYASDNTINRGGVIKIMKDTSYDILYINSFFSFGFAIVPLVARHLGIVSRRPCVIAPRGEFSPGALALKCKKKYAFINLFRWLRLGRDVCWQATSSLEKKDIQSALKLDVEDVQIVSNLIPKTLSSSGGVLEREQGPLRVIFLSRISPKKNLDFLLRALALVDASVELAIYGNKEDSCYWKKCAGLIQDLPSNIRVTVYDHVPHDRVRKVFADHDVFAFPTHGENFGHVIFEALSAATSVLVSESTPWVHDEDGAVEVLPLVEQCWTKKLISLANSGHQALTDRRKASVDYLKCWYELNESMHAMTALFQDVVDGK